MSWRDVFHISFGILKTNFLRTLLTTLGIATAVGLIIVLIGLGYGVREITIGAIVKSQSLLSLQIASGVDEGIPPLDESIMKKFGALPGVTDITPEFITEGQLEWNNKLISNTVSAGKPSLLDMEGVNFTHGRTLKEGETGIVISPQTLELLEATPEQLVNQPVLFGFVNTSPQQELIHMTQPLTVVGITDGKDSANMYILYDLVKATPNIQMNQVRILADSRDAVENLESTIKVQGYQVTTLLQTLDDARRVFKWGTFALGVIAAIALIVSAIGMFNTMTIALLERTREIGIMKAVGIMDSDILRLFLADAITIGFLGGIVGLFGGVAMGAIINAIVDRIAIANGGIAVDLFNYPVPFLVGIVLFPVILGLITGLYPALRAARLNPLQALRYE